VGAAETSDALLRLVRREVVEDDVNVEMIWNVGVQVIIIGNAGCIRLSVWT